MAINEQMNWRENIITQLQERNRSQTYCYQDLVQQSNWKSSFLIHYDNLTLCNSFADNKLFENANSLRSENLHLSIQVEKLKLSGNTLGNGTAGLSGNEVKLTERIQHLEQRLLTQQEELTELHKRKGENAQQIIDLNVKLQEMDKLLAVKDHK